jgi:hypothetical protein
MPYLLLCCLHHPVQSMYCTYSIHLLSLANQVCPLPQPFNNKLMTLSPTIDILNIISSRLEMTGSVVALRDKDVVIDSAFQWLVQWDWWTLVLSADLVFCLRGKGFTMNFSSILPRRSNPGSSSRWWLAVVSAMVETMAM